MPSAVKDSFTARDDGRIAFVMGGERFMLRRPTLGEFRNRRERLLDLAAQERQEDATDGDADVLAGQLSLTSEQRMEREDALLGWWRDTFAMLEENAKPLPDEDALPAWLLGPTIIPQSLQAWMAHPTAPGG